MTSLWIPGATIIPCNLDGGSQLGTEKYVTWHTYESKGYNLSALSGAYSLVAAGHGCTGCFNPVTGELVQMIPGNRASRTLVNISGGVQTNRAGAFHAQFEVIGDANRPWTQDLTDAGRATLTRIMAWLRDWGVPDIWPAGNPPVYPGGYQNRIGPAASGHYGHSQWQENTHGDPGAIDVSVLFGVSTPTPPPPPVGEKIPPTQSFHGNVYIGKLHRGVTNSDSVRRLQKALRDYPEIHTIPLNPHGVTGNYGSETEAMVREVYRVFNLWQPSFGWNKGDASTPGPKLLAKLGLRIVG